MSGTSSSSSSSSSSGTTKSYMHLEPGYPCFAGGPIYSPISRFMAVFIPQEGVFTPTATTWDGWQLPNDRVVLYQRVLDVFGSICGEIAKFNSEELNDSNCHGDLRNILTVTVVPRADYSLIPAGYLLILSTAVPVDEDMDLLTDFTPGSRYSEEPEMTKVAIKQLALRRKSRDPEWIVAARLRAKAADEKEGKRIHRAKGKPTAPDSWWEIMDRDAYIAMAAAYSDNKEATTDDMIRANITDSDNPANIMNVFSMANACRLVKNAGADPKYCEVRNYMYRTETGHAIVVNHPQKGITTWRLPIGSVTPKMLRNRLLPQIPRTTISDTDPVLLKLARDWGWPHDDPTAFERAKKALQMSSSSVEADDTLEGLAAKVAPVMKAFKIRADTARGRMEKKVYDRCTSEARSSFFLRKQRAKKGELVGILAEEEKVLNAIPITPIDDELVELKTELEEIANERYEKQKEFLALFFRIFSVHGKGSDSMKAVCAYRDEWIRTRPNNSLRFPTEPYWDNLTFFGNEVVSQISALETLFGAHNCHQQLMMMMIGSLHLYKPCNFHFNPLLLGDAAKGKSWALDQIAKIMISGTYMVTGGASAKADAIDDNKNIHNMIVINEEVLPSTMGVVIGGSKGSASSVSNDSSSMRRGQMTSQHKAYDRLVQDENGKWVRQRTDIPLNQSHYLAANLEWWQIHAATLSRFAVMNFNTLTWRKDVTQLDRMEAELTSRQMKQKELMFDKFRRNQFTIMPLFFLEQCNIIEPAGMSTVRSFVRTVLTVGRDRFRLTNTTNPRHLQRVHMLIEVYTLWHATNVFYDSYLGELREEKLKKEEIERRKKAKKAGGRDGKEEEKKGGEEYNHDEAAILRSQFDYLDMEKMLWSSIEIAVFALAHLKGQWESQETYRAMKAIEKLGGAPDDDEPKITIRTDEPEVIRLGEEDWKDAKESEGKSKPSKKHGLLPVGVGREEEEKRKKRDEEKRQRTEEDRKEFWEIRLPVTTTHHVTEDEHVQRLAAKMKNLMPAGMENALPGILKEWLATPCQDKEGNPIFALSFPPSGVARVLKSFTANNQPNRMRSTLEWVLSHSHFRNQTYPLGSTRHDMAYCWDSITPSHERRGPLRVSNPKWCTHEQIGGILDAAFHVPDSGDTKAPKEHKHIVIDDDPDAMTAMKRMEEVFVNHKSLRRMGWSDDPDEVYDLLTDANAFEKKIRSKVPRPHRRMRRYPEDMLKVEEEEEEEEEKEEEGEGKEEKTRKPTISVKARLELMERMRRTRLSDVPSPAMRRRTHSFSAFTSSGSEGKEGEGEDGEEEEKDNAEEKQTCQELEALAEHALAIRKRRQLERKHEFEAKARKKAEAKEMKEKKKEEVKEKKREKRRLEKEEAKKKKKEEKEKEGEEGEEEEEKTERKKKKRRKEKKKKSKYVDEEAKEEEEPGVTKEKSGTGGGIWYTSTGQQQQQEEEAS
jgi:hypothetical protein